MGRHRDTAFSPSFGNRPAQLLGRDGLVGDIVGALDSKPGSKERATVLLGQRGYGKTVLLWELADRARERGLAVANPTAVREGMLARIVEKLGDDAGRLLRRQRRAVTGGSVGALGFSAGLSLAGPERRPLSPEGRLERLVRDLSGRGVGTLLLVDELQANSAEVRALVSTYQELVGEGLDVSMVLAGLPGAVSATLNDRVLTFLNRARKASLAELARGEIDAYYKSAFEQCGVSVPAGLRGAAAEATHGSPYLMQLVGHYVVVYADGEGNVDEEALEGTLRSARAEFRNDVCETTLAALSRRDVDYLRAMAAASDRGQCRTAEVARRLGVSADYAQQYRRRLIDSGVIRAVRSGVVAFDVPYLEDHLRGGG